MTNILAIAALIITALVVILHLADANEDTTYELTGFGVLVYVALAASVVL